MSTKDYYSILGVEKSATSQEIKSAYKKLAKKYHPDVNKEPDSQDKFKEISQAYQVLSNDEKRTAYDQMGHSGFEQARQQGYGKGQQGYQQQYNVNFEDLFGGGGFRDPFDIFEDLFGGRGSGGQQRQQRSHRGEDLELITKTTFEEAFHGAEKEVTYERLNQCETCEGNGKSESSQVKTCTTCQGAGQVRHNQSIFGAQFSQVAPCPECKGKGEIITNPCNTCLGTGRHKGKKTLSIKVPAGVDSGMQIRYSGQGNAGERNSPPGDLYVTFKVEPHALFTREGNDIHLDLPLSVTQATLGDTVMLPLVEGKEKVTIKPGTQPHDTIRLKGNGFPSVGRGHQQGDLIATIKITIPQKLNKKQKEAFQKLKEVEDTPPTLLDKLFG